MWRAHSPTPATVLAVLALFVALGGTSYAVTSSGIPDAKGIFHGCVDRGSGALRLVGAGRKCQAANQRGKHSRVGELAIAWSQSGPAGMPGVAGSPGPPGQPGPSHGYSTQFANVNGIPLEADGTDHTLLSLTVPPGSYVVTAAFQGQTVPPDAVGNQFRYDCYLSTGGQFSQGGKIFARIDARVGMTSNVESYFPLNGGFTGAGPIELNCSAGNSHPLLALSGSMVAINVGALN